MLFMEKPPKANLNNLHQTKKPASKKSLVLSTLVSKGASNFQ